MMNIIAIDGPAASGKGTLARRLAEHLNFAYLDTGSIYRAVGLMLLRDGDDPDDVQKATSAAKALSPESLPDLVTDSRLRSPECSEAASKVAAMDGVRAALLDFQRRFATHPPGGRGGSILDGRDIGTVICPNASAKLYIVADVNVRAQRRYKELKENGKIVTESEVLDDMKRRDERDASRDTAPMKAAEDALVMDTTQLNADEVFIKALDFIAEKLHESEPQPQSISA